MDMEACCSLRRFGRFEWSPCTGTGKQLRLALVGGDLDSPWTVWALFSARPARWVVPLGRHSARKSQIKVNYRCIGCQLHKFWGLSDQMRDSREQLVCCGAWCNAFQLWLRIKSMWISHLSKKTRQVAQVALSEAETMWQWHEFGSDRWQLTPMYWPSTKSWGTSISSDCMRSLISCWCTWLMKTSRSSNFTISVRRIFLTVWHLA